MVRRVTPLSPSLSFARPTVASALTSHHPLIKSPFGPHRPTTMKIRYAAKTDVGMKRTHNEDFFTFLADENLYIVADGMGGHASGEVASKLAAETLVEFYH